MSQVEASANPAEWKARALAAWRECARYAEEQKQKEIARNREQATSYLVRKLAGIGIAVNRDAVTLEDRGVLTERGCTATVLVAMAPGVNLEFSHGDHYSGNLYLTERDANGQPCARFGSFATPTDLGCYLAHEMEPYWTAPKASTQSVEQSVIRNQVADGEAVAESVSAVDSNHRALSVFLDSVAAEVQRAEKLFPPLNSSHEAYAVIKEELEELWEQVRLRSGDRDPAAMAKELRQAAAMCVRAAVNLGLAGGEGDGWKR
jgi:hypothetical protein